MSDTLTWNDILRTEKQKPYFINIIKTIEKERKSGVVIYPPHQDIFNAFRFTKFSDIKVVILGQDPYHGPGQAHGLAFSVRPETAIPPSLLNIFKELKRSMPNFIRPRHGCLISWAQQGVLLLNTILTVRIGQACSHANIGWEIFTKKVISLINLHLKGIIFVLWGSRAQKKATINQYRHLVLKAAHPSPFSAHQGFFGCNHFLIINQYLKEQNKNPINWMSILE